MKYTSDLTLFIIIRMMEMWTEIGDGNWTTAEDLVAYDIIKLGEWLDDC